MAIPFNLPSDEETEDVYRRLDQLIIDLYDILRQILLRRRIVREPRARSGRTEQPESLRHHHHHHEDQNTSDDDEEAEEEHSNDNRVALLPDLVLGTLMPSTSSSNSSSNNKFPVPPPRRKRRRHEKQFTDEVEGPSSFTSLPRPSPSWLNVGIELRQIAEEFTYNAQTGEGLTKKRSEIKASSLFSLLVPPPLTKTVWTTVIILVGWRLLARQR